jgi:hypothetical protein
MAVSVSKWQAILKRNVIHFAVKSARGYLEFGLGRVEKEAWPEQHVGHGSILGNYDLRIAAVK